MFTVNRSVERQREREVNTAVMWLSSGQGQSEIRAEIQVGVVVTTTWRRNGNDAIG